MLHELLLALAGHPGDLFTPEGTVSGALPRMHPGTKEALLRLLPLAQVYRALNTYTATGVLPPTKVGTGNRPPPLPSVYVDTFRSGLRPYLTAYRSDLASLEARCIHGESPPLPAIAAALSSHAILLPHLLAIAQSILDQGLRGPTILDFLEERSLTGIPPLAQALASLALDQRALLYRQITAWTAWGRVVDPHEELFRPQHAELLGDIISGITPSTERTDPSARRISLQSTSLPRTISPSAARDLIFIGDAMRALSAHNALSEEEASTLARNHVAELRSLIPPSGPPREILSRTLNLQRRRVAGRLWQAALIGHDAARQLSAFRRFFLLGDGPFADRVATALYPGMREREVLAAWRLAAEGTFAEDDPHFPDFTWSNPPPSAASGSHTHPSTTNKWLSDTQIGCGVSLTLGYRLTWPMDLIVSPSDISHYATAFSFLLIIKRTLVRLHATTLHPHPVWSPTFLALRHRILTWVSALYSHFQMDVIQVGFEALKEKWMAASRVSTMPTDAEGDTSVLGGESLAKDFEGLHTAHARYIQRISRGCLLHQPSLLTGVRSVLRASVSLCEWAESARRSRADDATATTNLAAIQKAFDTHASFVFRAISGASRPHPNPPTAASSVVGSPQPSTIASELDTFDDGLSGHVKAADIGTTLLDQLLLRLNWNGYYQASGHPRASTSAPTQSHIP